MFNTIPLVRCHFQTQIPRNHHQNLKNKQNTIKSFYEELIIFRTKWIRVDRTVYLFIYLFIYSCCIYLLILIMLSHHTGGFVSSKNEKSSSIRCVWPLSIGTRVCRSWNGETKTLRMTATNNNNKNNNNLFNHVIV